MSTLSLSGNDTVVINGKPLVDFADGNVVELTFPSDIMQVKTGKNGNSIFGVNETGRQCDVKIRLLRASSDDKFLNGLLVQQQANPAGFPLLVAQFAKKIGDGQGNITSDTYVMAGGVFQKPIEAVSNVDGDTAQSVSVYMFKFTQVIRAIT